MPWHVELSLSVYSLQQNSSCHLKPMLSDSSLMRSSVPTHAECDSGEPTLDGCVRGSAEHTVDCWTCPAGREVQQNNGEESCQPCPPGRFRSSSSQPSCIFCPAGEEPTVSQTSCVECGHGKYRPDGEATGFCLRCAGANLHLLAPGDVRRRRAVSCTNCLRGTPPAEDQFLDECYDPDCENGPEGAKVFDGCCFCPIRTYGQIWLSEGGIIENNCKPWSVINNMQAWGDAGVMMVTCPDLHGQGGLGDGRVCIMTCPWDHDAFACNVQYNSFESAARECQGLMRLAVSEGWCLAVELPDPPC